MKCLLQVQKKYNTVTAESATAARDITRKAKVVLKQTAQDARKVVGTWRTLPHTPHDSITTARICCCVVLPCAFCFAPLLQGIYSLLFFPQKSLSNPMPSRDQFPRVVKYLQDVLPSCDIGMYCESLHNCFCTLYPHKYTCVFLTFSVHDNDTQNKVSVVVNSVTFRPCLRNEGNVSLSPQFRSLRGKVLFSSLESSLRNFELSWTVLNYLGLCWKMHNFIMESRTAVDVTVPLASWTSAAGPIPWPPRRTPCCRKLALKPLSAEQVRVRNSIVLLTAVRSGRKRITLFPWWWGRW